MVFYATAESGFRAPEILVRRINHLAGREPKWEQLALADGWYQGASVKKSRLVSGHRFSDAVIAEALSRLQALGQRLKPVCSCSRTVWLKPYPDTNPEG
jgi:hypothetical protein